jgi:ferric-dicitrate binding protein FerR (iron transport regulator)/TolA-binding protein
MTTRAEHPAPACTRFQELRLDAAERTLCAAERSFVTEHGARCADCRRLAALAETMRFDGSAPAAKPLDELARRRWIRDLVQEAREEPANTAYSPHRLREPSRWRRVAALAAAAAVLLGASYLVGEWIGGGASDPRTPQPATSPQVRVLLASGDVRLDGDALRLRSAVRSGARLVVGAGRAAVELPQGSVVVAERSTRVHLVSLSADRIHLELRRGAMLLSVTRRRPGARFEVQTPHGRIRVVGTLFAVDSGPQGSRVRVYRGRVRVLRGQCRQEVPAGRELGLKPPRSRPEPLSGSPGARIRGERLLALLARRAEGRPSVLDLHTRPSGVSVEVDGTHLGPTPLVARLTPGRRRLELRPPEGPALRENLELPDGGTVHREFDLRGSRARARARARARPPDARPAGQQPSRPEPGEAELPRRVAARPDPRPEGRLQQRGGPLRPRSRPLGRARLAPAHRPARPRSVPPAARPPARSRQAPDLLQQARRLRSARDYRGAARVYQEIVSRYPRSAEARVSRVSLGMLYLGSLWKPSRALQAFDAYLSAHPKGGLAPEARFGRAKALRALGRRAEEIRALEALIQRHPRSVQAATARQRLQQLGWAKGGVQPRPAQPRPRRGSEGS